MYNALSEAKALAALPEKLNALCAKMPAAGKKKEDAFYNEARELLACHRYPQPRICQEHKLSIRYIQLVRLAQYYYHCEEPEPGGTRREHAEQRLLEWLDAMTGAFKKLFDLPEDWDEFRRSCRPNFQVPFYGHTTALIAVIQRAEYAGKPADLKKYPDPADLLPAQCLPANRDDFWKAQLAALMTLDGGQQTRLVKTAFAIMIWYADRYSRHLEILGSIGMPPGDALPWFHVVGEHLQNEVFHPLAKSDSYKELFRKFDKYIQKDSLPAKVPKPVIRCTFADPANVEIPEGLELPDIRTFDNGFRLFPPEPKPQKPKKKK